MGKEPVFAGGGDWDGTSITRLEGEFPQLNGRLMEQTFNRCPNCNTKMIRYPSDHSGVHLCMGCKTRWVIR